MFSFFKKKKVVKETKKEYILMVTTKYDDGGYGSHWHGWSQDLILTYEEALLEKEKIKERFYEVEILKLDDIKI